MPEVQQAQSVQPKKKSKKWPWIVLGIFMFFIALVMIGAFAEPSAFEEGFEEGMKTGSEVPKKELAPDVAKEEVTEEKIIEEIKPNEVAEEKKATFSKSVSDPTEDCISVQTDKSTACNKAVDITLASMDQKNGVAIIDIELTGNVPSSKDELKVGELGAETYQYQVWAEINGKWSIVLYGDITDALGISGECGLDTISCDSSQVNFSINGKKVKITGPLKSEISKFKIKALYQSGSLDKDDIIDEVESE